MVDIKLLLNALGKFAAGLVLVGVMLFVPAGTMNYSNGWLFILLLFVPMFLLGGWLWIRNRELLAKRLNSKENEDEQKKVVSLSLILFIVGFIVSALDYRFRLTYLPLWVTIFGSVLLLVSYGLYAEVMRENTYLSRTVEVQEGQQVIDTGLYGIVRHPMYFATTLLFLSFPLVLGSGIGFVIFLAQPLLLVKRIRNEEEVLEKGLEGYVEYKQKVKYRLIPFIW
ncbi:MAG: isoprenylcysteine carboxylmethyltransferase family protein [Oscillospiraceae bacterium]|nr:isoprenylcysteine carboxylmethyltransferase family protein [Oscillospiraceae bacterium]